MALYEYEDIRPIIGSAEQDAMIMKCVFRCPVSSAEFEAQGALKRDEGLLGDITDRARNSVVRSVSQSLNGQIRKFFGSGIIGKAAQSTAQGLVQKAKDVDDTRFTEEERQAAVVRAFEQVASNFVLDPERGWMATETASKQASEFDEMVEENKLESNYDRGVLARMLIEIAAADRDFADAERGFVSEHLPEGFGTVQEIHQKPKLTALELGEVSEGAVRETMLLLCWSLALCDHDVEPSEQQRLLELAAGLEISQERALQLREQSTGELLDRALDKVYATGTRDEAAFTQAAEFAAAIGMDEDAFKLEDIRYRKRHELF